MRRFRIEIGFLWINFIVFVCLFTSDGGVLARGGATAVWLTGWLKGLCGWRHVWIAPNGNWMIEISRGVSHRWHWILLKQTSIIGLQHRLFHLTRQRCWCFIIMFSSSFDDTPEIVINVVEHLFRFFLVLFSFFMPYAFQRSRRIQPSME